MNNKHVKHLVSFFFSITIKFVQIKKNKKNTKQKKNNFVFLEKTCLFVFFLIATVSVVLL